nr:glutamate-5-semialdehyde dehydrogenase [Nitrospirota bacterium]
MVEVPVKMYVAAVAKKAKEAARATALVSGSVKTKALLAMADRLEAEEEAIFEDNRLDAEAVGKSLPGETNRDTVKAAVDRVRFAEDAVKEMAKTLRQVAEFPDPVGEMTKLWRQPNGMQVSRMRVPLGVIGIVSDGGPPVTTECIALCLKTGNVSLVRGGPEWAKSGARVATILREAAEAAGVPAGGITFVERNEKDAALELLRLNKHLDAILPRGGAGLRRTVIEQTRLPVLGQDVGVSHVYIDKDADLPLAQNIVVNSKAQQPTAPNAADCVLVHQAVARSLLSALIRRLLDEFKVEVRGCPKTISMTGSFALPGYMNVIAATDDDWGKQFLSKTLAIKVVTDMDEALAHIAHYGPGHTDTIVTRNYASAMRFIREVDASAVLVNASTRLHDGQEFGLGGGLGVNTTKIPARGPVSLEELTCQKYVVMGTGQLRHPHPVPVAYEDAIMLKRPS